MRLLALKQVGIEAGFAPGRLPSWPEASSDQLVLEGQLWLRHLRLSLVPSQRRRFAKIFGQRRDGSNA